MLIDALHLLTTSRYYFSGFRHQYADGATASIAFHERTRSRGEAPILFIHGLGTSSSSWVKVLPALRSRRPLYCLDLPGFGLSRFTGSADMPIIARIDKALDEFIEKVLPPRFTVVGHSLGGWLALRLAIRHPNLLDQSRRRAVSGL
jgi:pimeloyl-ACP methyl ester carboxylesterase